MRTIFLLEVPPAGPPLHSGGPQKLNPFCAGGSLPQKSVPAALSFAGLHVGTTILTPRIRAGPLFIPALVAALLGPGFGGPALILG